MFPPRVLTRIFTWRAISSGCKKFRKLVQLCFSMINHFLCRVWCCDLFSKKYDFMMGDMENNPYKIAQVIFFWLNIVSLSNTRDVGQFFLIGDQKVQDDRGEQFLFPQRWTKVSAKKIYISEFSLSLFTLLANLLFAMKSSSSAGSSSHYYRVDVAFICMCAFAIDELFSDDWSRWKTIKHFGQKIPLGDYLPSLSVPIEMPNYHQENNVNTHAISCKMNVIFNFNISMQENITLKHS